MPAIIKPERKIWQVPRGAPFFNANHPDSVEWWKYPALVRELRPAGVPPQKFLNQARSAGVSMPDWMGETIAAVGQGTDNRITTAQGKLKAARAAELDAKRKLAEQVFGLTISSNTTVRDFITQYDEIASQVHAVLAGAVADPADFSGEVAHVRVSMPAAKVWSVINQHTIIVDRRG